MNICFVLPGFSRTPIGGYKIVYEYANRLEKLGNSVIIVSMNDKKMKQFNLPESIRITMVNLINKIEPLWFNLDKKIIKISNLEKNFLDKIKKSDVVFATGIQTVEFVKNNFDNAKKLYLIQGYENWSTSDAYLQETYSYGFINIVVSNWLKNIVDQYSKSPSILIKNPIDTSIYKSIISQDKRKEHCIGILYHTQELKGLKYAMDALYQLKELYNDLTVEMFGMFQRPKEFPEWIHYTKSASQNKTVEIYNKVQIFLCASIEEGYGLTGLEAMACGACLVSTSYNGVYEYAKNNYNSLLSPVKDVDALVRNVIDLFENPEKRMYLANNGIESVKELNWDNAIEKIYELIK